MIFLLAGLLAAGGAGAATIVVNDASDALHGLGCAMSGSGTCTLRDAITFANANAGPDEIHFAIFGSGVHTITLDSDLPAVAGDDIPGNGVTIDGYTQPGSSPNTNGPGLGDNAVLTIEINGNGKGCLSLRGDANTVRGLVINRCGASAIVIVFAAGGLVPRPNVMAGNFIGVDAAGAGPLPNETGVLISYSEGPGIVIGGATPAARNVISGNRGAGIVFADDFGAAPTIQGNFIGTDATGTTAVPNGGSGIEIGTGMGTFTETEIRDNLVSGNAGKGIALNRASALIHGNLIGTDVSGALPLGNRSTGVWITDMGDVHSVISGNTIAFNGIGDPVGGGIVNFSGSHHYYDSDPTILGNSIFDNTNDGSLPDRGLGIDLAGPGPHDNVPCNFSGEGQAPQNSPVLTTAVADGSAIRIRGTLNTLSPTVQQPATWRIEFFASPICDPSGYGEGQTFLGSTDVTPDEPCNAVFDVTLPVAVPVGQYITATATDRSTSEFSLCIPVEPVGSLGAVVNRMVTLISITTETSTVEALGGPAGTMTVRATFKNTSSTRIEAPFFVVKELSPKYFLLNADGGPGGAGARLTPDVGADGVLEPGESVTTEFIVGLPRREPFRFFVDLWGKPIP